jgi:hypothetical protein
MFRRGVVDPLQLRACLVSELEGGMSESPTSTESTFAWRTVGVADLGVDAIAVLFRGISAHVRIAGESLCDEIGVAKEPSLFGRGDVSTPAGTWRTGCDVDITVDVCSAGESCRGEKGAAKEPPMYGTGFLGTSESHTSITFGLITVASRRVYRRVRGVDASVGTSAWRSCKRATKEPPVFVGGSVGVSESQAS